MNLRDKEEVFLVSSCGDGSYDSYLVFGLHEARKKIAAQLYDGPYEEAQKDEMVSAYLAEFDDHENWFMDDAGWQADGEQFYIRVNRVLNIEGRQSQRIAELQNLIVAKDEIIKQCLHARQCNAPYGQTEKYPSVNALKEALEINPANLVSRAKKKSDCDHYFNSLKSAPEVEFCEHCGLERLSKAKGGE